MSIEAMLWVFQHSAAKANERLVLLAIADEADDEGRNAFPSIRRLARKANCNPDTVVEAVKRLEELGELEVVRPTTQGRGHFNRYKVLLGNIGISEHSSGVKGRTQARKRSDSGRYLSQPIGTNPSTDPSTDPAEKTAAAQKVRTREANARAAADRELPRSFDKGAQALKEIKQALADKAS